jgi:hypothetical protein
VQEILHGSAGPRRSHGTKAMNCEQFGRASLGTEIASSRTRLPIIIDVENALRAGGYAGREI